MDFKNWLSENIIDNATSWLTPQGIFHPISRKHKTGRWATHSDWALENQKKMSDLFDNGWMRVTFIGNELYASNDSGKFVTRKQKNALNDLMKMSHGRFTSVVWENGQGIERDITSESKSFKVQLVVESKNSLDDIKYGRTKDERYLRNAPTPFFGDSWKKWKIETPPSNSSKITAKELKQIANEQKSLTKKQKEVIKQQDKLNIETEFFKLLESLGEKLSKKEKQEITKIQKELTTIGLHYKEHFDRPRPIQLMKKVHPEEKPLKANSGTAAYPSGHALIGEFLALYLSDLYPQHKKEIKKLGKELGINRILGGFHYPSDFEVGVKLAKKLYKNLE